MANLTDPLARPVHGTNPQNLIEYITRQKIYDSQFWKEECFGLTAADVTDKAAKKIDMVGGVYGGFLKPTRFLSLTLKLLQIQPDDEIVEEWIKNEDLKYIRALGVLYIRLTGRPNLIYTSLEPLLRDYRKLRCRETNCWKIIYMDELIYDLLTKDRIFGIALPRLPARTALEEAGYLDEPRISYLGSLTMEEAEDMLSTLALNGSKTAILALSKRGKQIDKPKEAELVKKSFIVENTDDQEEEYSCTQLPNEKKEVEKITEHKKTKKKKFGSLFKEKKGSKAKKAKTSDVENTTQPLDENSEEYWNEQRAKLGLKPLK